ncbi:PREDICTED: uncharacterized protein LOC103327111 [Prunus mume]|uniref:Uncharacterized protein LOC103327111 n=1 Tax=Prunus mume TaxID=102107 RepID=A0ABM0NNY5_PRUMU|nr:PREDICTED: uncharacterized protein LOC103327111 [Prunus mume]
MGSCDSDDDDEQLLSSILGSQNKVKHMDLSKGGVASTKFKNNMMKLIRTHHMDILFLCEPRNSGEKALNIATSQGFACVEIVDSVGFSGGLWLMWDDSRVHLDIIGTSDQSITACVSWKDQSPWLLTVIYANSSGFKREKLWEYLDFVATCHQLPWLLAGDFNEMLGVDDKLGGASVNRLKGFKRWFDDNNMMDLGFYGAKFTWRNNKVFEKLDHAIFNMKPFRFEAIWLKHEHFNDLIAAVWGSSGSAIHKTLNLIEPLKNWNSTVFGHLRQKKARLLAHLDGIQRALCRGPNLFLKQLEISLMDDFNEVLDHEALFWKQKSMINWLQGGDRNTKFFHLTTVIRSRRNKIERLKNSNGLLVKEAAGMKALAMEYFSGQFNQVQVVVPNMVLPNLFPSISNDDLALLGKNIELDDLK